MIAFLHAMHKIALSTGAFIVKGHIHILQYCYSHWMWITFSKSVWSSNLSEHPNAHASDTCIGHHCVFYPVLPSPKAGNMLAVSMWSSHLPLFEINMRKETTEHNTKHFASTCLLHDGLSKCVWCLAFLLTVIWSVQGTCWYLSIAQSTYLTTYLATVATALQWNWVNPPNMLNYCHISDETLFNNPRLEVFMVSK